MRFLWLSRDCERIMPRPRGVCRRVGFRTSSPMWCSAWVEVLDHTHWAFGMCFDVGPEVHADAAASFCLREVARRLGHVYRFDCCGRCQHLLSSGVRGWRPREEGFGVLFDQVDDLVGDESVKNQRNDP